MADNANRLSYSPQIPRLTPSAMKDQAVLDRITDHLRSLTLIAGDGISVSRLPSAGTVITADRIPSTGGSSNPENDVYDFKVTADGASIISIADGDVWWRGYLADNVTVNGISNATAISGTYDFWVEIVSENDTITVKSDLQGGPNSVGGFSTIADAGGYCEVNADSVTLRIPIVQVIAATLYVTHLGDIFLDTLFVPSIAADMQGSAGAQSVVLLAVDPDETGTADVGDNANDVLLSGNRQDITIELGDISQMSGSAKFTWRGKTVDFATKTISEVDVSTEDKVKFSGNDIAAESDHGLVQTLAESSRSDIPEIGSDKTWLGILSGVVYHKKSPAVDNAATYGEGSFFVAATSGGAVTTEVKYDKNGHIYKVGSDYIDGPATTNKQFKNCATLSYVVTSSASTFTAGKVYEGSDGYCYEYIGTTPSAVTPSAPTITSTPEYADCSACDSGKTRVLWRKCSDDSIAAVFDDGDDPTDDYAWLCLSSVWVKCYAAGMTGASATSPTPSILELCSGTPAECADLTGIPASDDFGGTGCNTADKTSVLAGLKWTYTVTSGTGSSSVSGGALTLTADAGTSRSGAQSKHGTITGKLLMSASINATQLDYAGTSIAFAIINMNIGGNDCYIGVMSNKQTNFQGFEAYLGSSIQQFTTAATSANFRITRDGSNLVKAEYNTGSGWVTLDSRTISGNITGSGSGSMYCRAISTAIASIATFDNFVLEDGDGNSIIIDPTGVACT